MQDSSQVIQHQVADAIRKASHLTGRILRYEARNGNVTLHGTVGSYFQKQIAQEAIRRIDGVHSVTNLLEVAWSEPPAAAMI